MWWKFSLRWICCGSTPKDICWTRHWPEGGIPVSCTACTYEGFTLSNFELVQALSLISHFQVLGSPTQLFSTAQNDAKCQGECNGQRPWLWLWWAACFSSFGPVGSDLCTLIFNPQLLFRWFAERIEVWGSVTRSAAEEKHLSAATELGVRIEIDLYEAYDVPKPERDDVMPTATWGTWVAWYAPFAMRCLRKLIAWVFVDIWSQKVWTSFK